MGGEGISLAAHKVLLDLWWGTVRQKYPVLGGIGGIALIVSALGVTAVMLAALAQRTREIGIRLAVGARRRDIVRQFLVEATAVAVGGGVVGTALGFATGPLIGAAFGMSSALAPWFLPTALGLAFVTGLASGVLPALRAARLDPSLALSAD